MRRYNPVDMQPAQSVAIVNLSPATDDVVRAALRALGERPKTLPAKLFYDERGSTLFERICELPEYYLTRTEIGILRRHVDEIAAALGPGVQLVEPGSGAGTKTTLLLDALEGPIGYVPIDISWEHLVGSTRRIGAQYPSLEVQAICADFAQGFEAPEPAVTPQRRVVFFPGSSIGNLHADDARAFLGRLADLVGIGGGLLLGFDLRKDEDVLVAAYDDAQGVTAEFNRNMLRHLNRVAGADFRPERFEHEVRWNAPMSRIEMHLVSSVAQEVRLAGQTVAFARGESVRTECCYKYGPEGVAGLAERFAVHQTWFDEARQFGVQYLLCTMDSGPTRSP